MNKQYRPTTCKMCGTDYVPTGARSLYCQDCSKKAQRIYRRRWYQKNKNSKNYRAYASLKGIERDKRLPLKARARDILGEAIRYNRIKKGLCKVCGAKKVQGHHPDYNKPLDVIWLCAVHHRELHQSFYQNKMKRGDIYGK